MDLEQIVGRVSRSRRCQGESDKAVASFLLSTPSLPESHEGE